MLSSWLPLKLPVEEMSEKESDKTKALVDLLDSLTEEGVICKDIGQDEDGDALKAPFFRLYQGGS